MKMAEWLALMDKVFDADKSQYILEKIWENDRWFDFKAFNRTAQVCYDYMRECGLEEVELTSLVADGKTPYGDWALPKAWDVEDAKLELLENGGETVVADYNAVPCALSINSAPTPKGGYVAELVAIEAADADTPDIKGKLLLTTKPAQTLVKMAKKHGAIGIVSDFFPLYPGVRDTREQMHETTRWDNNFISPINDTGLFAFNITPDMGDFLRAKMSKGEKLTMRATVDARIYDGENKVASCAILGSDPNAKELFLYGHLYEEGAHDNASGCALFIEVLRAAMALIQEGKLPRPKHTIRLIMGYECVGSTGWLVTHEKEAANMLCGIVADMIGTEAIDNSVMTVRIDPMSNYTFIDSALKQVNLDYKRLYAPDYNWIITKFQIASDNMIGDPIWGIPTTAMISEPALSYHSSMDTPDRIERHIMHRNGVILGALALAVAMGGAEEGDWMLDAVDADIDALLKEDGVTELSRYILERARINAVRLAADVCGESLSDKGKARAAAAVCPERPEILANPAGVCPDAAALVPVRLVKGCLTFAADAAASAGKWSPAWNTELHVPLFWADGKRNLWEIAVLSSAEMEEEGKITENFNRIYEFFSFLTEHKYMRFEVTK